MAYEEAREMEAPVSEAEPGALHWGRARTLAKKGSLGSDCCKEGKIVVG